MSNGNGSWPYHLYTGNDPKKQGSYVKCKNNPCLIHGGTDIMATSEEDAYQKANENNPWGFAGSFGNSSAEPTPSEPKKPENPSNGMYDDEANAILDEMVKEHETDNGIITEVSKEAYNFGSYSYDYKGNGWDKYDEWMEKEYSGQFTVSNDEKYYIDSYLKVHDASKDEIAKFFVDFKKRKIDLSDSDMVDKASGYFDKIKYGTSDYKTMPDSDILSHINDKFGSSKEETDALEYLYINDNSQVKSMIESVKSDGDGYFNNPGAADAYHLVMQELIKKYYKPVLEAQKEKEAKEEEAKKKKEETKPKVALKRAKPKKKQPTGDDRPILNPNVPNDGNLFNEEAKYHYPDWLKVHQADTPERKKYIEERDAKLKADGLYIYDSPLFHYIDKNTRVEDIAGMSFEGIRKSSDYGVMGKLDDATDKLWATGLSSGEQSALKAYSGNGYTQMNKDLMEGKISKSYVKEQIVNVNSAMNKTEGILSEDTVFYRTRYMSQTASIRGGEELEIYKKISEAIHSDNPTDVVIQRPNYLSTTTKTSFSGLNDHSKFSMVIKAPAGTRGISLHKHGNHPDEYEYLADKCELRVIGIYEMGEMHRINGNTENGYQHSHHAYPVVAVEIIQKDKKKK